MNRNTVFNLILFAVLSVAIFGGWWLIETTFFPKPPQPEPTKTEEKKGEKPSPKLVRDPVQALTGGGVASEPEPKPQPKASRETQLAVVGGGLAVPASRGPGQQLIPLSGDGYNLQVLVTNRGAGVQQVVIPAFDQASRAGKTALARDPETGELKPYPLELVPGYYRDPPKDSVLKDGPHHYLKAGEVGPVPDGVQLAPPSYTLLHYDAAPEGDTSHPSAELATRLWTLVRARAGTDEQPGEVVFETTLAEQHVRIVKTFTLAKTEFHVRMKLEFFATPDRPADAKFHYQISGPRNLPIEGEWYAGVQRNAIVGCKATNGSAYRAVVDATHVVTEHGSTKYTPNSNDVPGAFTFAAVVTQFFAAAICVEPGEPGTAPPPLWKYVRATREGAEPDADKPQLGDITVRAVSNPVEPTKDEPVEHRYWLYHGPTKVRLLNALDRLDDNHRKYGVDRALVEDQYVKGIGLNTITDAPTPGWFGAFTGGIGWTWLVVTFTDLMHGILGWMHVVVPNWGVNILMLTVLVRLVLMLPSRRQQASMMKMQDKMAAMKPELDKLQERYKADPQRLNQEKTRLMLAHGVNPLSSMGGCLLMFAQMPVFLGLYYCLQESIFFRLDNFLWVPNLAAPDMLFSWSESIPFVSTPDQLGHSWYLGPFVNILPVVAVALMYLNFKISSPPPTDEQQAAQQRTMKFMMIFMGVFFYKMAAGLCLYFICSTGWGMLERWLLKRKKKQAEADPLVLPPAASVNGPTKTTAPPKPTGFMGRLMEKLEEVQKQAEAKGQQIINDPQKKQPPGNDQGGGKGKKRRKK